MLFMPSKCYQRDPAVLGCPPAAGGRKAVTLQMPGSVQGTGCAEMNATERALNSRSLHSYRFFILKQVYEAGMNAPFFADEKTWAC